METDPKDKTEQQVTIDLPPIVVPVIMLHQQGEVVKFAGFLASLRMTRKRNYKH